MLTFSKGGNEQGEKAEAVVSAVVRNVDVPIQWTSLEFSTQVSHICLQICFAPKQQM